MTKTFNANGFLDFMKSYTYAIFARTTKKARLCGYMWRQRSSALKKMKKATGSTTMAMPTIPSTGQAWCGFPATHSCLAMRNWRISLERSM